MHNIDNWLHTSSYTCVQYYRHPESSERPSFTALYQYLHTSPQNELLSLDITDDELVESPQCGSLGAPLESGSRLFMDIQLKYSEV